MHFVKRWVGLAVLASVIGVELGCNENPAAPPPPASTPAPAPAETPVAKTGKGTSQPGPGSSASADSTLNRDLQQPK